MQLQFSWSFVGIMMLELCILDCLFQYILTILCHIMHKSCLVSRNVHSSPPCELQSSTEPFYNSQSTSKTQDVFSGQAVYAIQINHRAVITQLQLLCVLHVYSTYFIQYLDIWHVYSTYLLQNLVINGPLLYLIFLAESLVAVLCSSVSFGHHFAFFHNLLLSPVSLSPGFSPAIFSSYLIPLPSGSRRGSLRRAVPRAMMSSLHHYILLLPFLVTISPKAKQKGGATQGPEIARRFEGCSGARLKYPQTHTRRLVPAAPHVNPTVLQLPPPSVPSKPCVPQAAPPSVPLFRVSMIKATRMRPQSQRVWENCIVE